MSYGSWLGWLHGARSRTRMPSMRHVAYNEWTSRFASHAVKPLDHLNDRIASRNCIAASRSRIGGSHGKIRMTKTVPFWTFSRTGRQAKLAANGRARRDFPVAAPDLADLHRL